VPIDSLPAAQAQAWRALDVSVIPPKGYAQDIHLTQEVLNHTGGRVDDATARKWAEDYLRTDQWGLWGTENLQVDGFFNHLAPADSVTQRSIFGDNYGAMDKATNSKGRLRVQNLTITRLTLVVVPADVKAALVRRYSYPQPIPDYALIVDHHGPAGAWVVSADGSETPYLQLDSNHSDRGFFVGEAKKLLGTLGEIWYLHTDLSCSTNDFLRVSCGS